MRSSGAPCLAHVALARLPAVRWATRVELYRGLVRGRAFLKSNFAQGASLRAAAEAACMSPFHFNRLFRTLFGETPHEFVTAVRLDEAKRLLCSTTLPLGDVAYRVGLQQASSFSRLFRNRHGMSPRAYRASLQFRNIGQDAATPQAVQLPA